MVDSQASVPFRISLRARPCASGPGWSEHFLDKRAERVASAELALESGYSVVSLKGLATLAECDSVRGAASLIAKSERIAAAEQPSASRWYSPDNPGRVRFPVMADALLGDADQELCDALLVRATARLSEIFPTLILKLFRDALGTTIARNSRLAFSPQEPAINVYEFGGRFRPHKDDEALTVLLPLSSSDMFAGGGTAFWSVDDLDPVRPCTPTSAQPTLVLLPPAGTALIFTGAVTHAAAVVTSGERAVLVASFSLIPSQ